MSDQRFSAGLAEAVILSRSIKGFESTRSAGLVYSVSIMLLTVKERPKPAVSCTNSFAPVLWNSGIQRANSSNIRVFLCSHWPSMGLYTGWQPGSTRPALFFATSIRKSAPARSKWFTSIQPNRSVPPIEVMTMRFLISTFPIFHGVNSGFSLSSIAFPPSCVLFLRVTAQT